MDDVKPDKDHSDNQSQGTQIPVTTGDVGSVITPAETPNPEPTVTPEVNAPVESAPDVPVPAPSMETTPTPETPVSSEVTPSAVAEAPKDDVMPGLENESDTPPNDAPAESSTPLDTAAVVPSAAMAVKKKGSGTGLVIAVVIVVVAVLAAVGYFAFAKNKDAAKEDNAATDTTQTADPGDSETPDSASTAIDDSLKNLDDTKDFSSTDINDTALGL